MLNGEIQEGITVKNEIADEIRRFVTLILPFKSARAETLLSKRDTAKFISISLIKYYQLAKMNDNNFVDVNGEWINQIALSLNYAKSTVYTRIHNELKPCLAEYMELPSYSKKIKDIMAEFYDKHLSKW